MADLRQYAREAAGRAGTAPETFVRQIQQESAFNPNAHNDSGADGIAQIIERWHPAMVGRTRDPYASLDYAAGLMASYHRKLGSYRKALAAYNWGSGNVVGYTRADGVVVPPWDGRRETLPAETRHYLDVILGEGWPEPDEANAPSNMREIMRTEGKPLRVTEGGVRLRQGPGTDSAVLATLEAGTEAVPLTDHAWRQVRVGDRTGWIAAEFLTSSVFSPSSEVQKQEVRPRRTFDPTTPTELQRQDWTCSIRSTMWLLKSIGIAVTPDEAQDAMSPRYVTPELGLLDATGAGIVSVLDARWGVEAFNVPNATFDQIASIAGTQPVAIGGRNWGGPGKGHWSAVRGFDGTRLLLANPASGTVYGDASLTREQWAWRGPWSAVVVPVAEDPAQPSPDDLAALRQQVVSLTAQLEDKARRLDTEVSKVGYMTGDLADALQAVVNTLRSLRPPAA